MNFLAKRPKNVNENNANHSQYSQIFKPRLLALENEIQKKPFYFHILRWMGFLMMPLTILYDEYIDQ